MNPRSFDACRLDVAAFALAEGKLAGEWPLAELTRLLQDALPLGPDSPARTVVWAAAGELRAASGREPQIRLRLQARTALQLCCQRCLQPMTTLLDLQTALRFARGEKQAEELDEDSEEDVLALTPALDLRELIEDELILALPLVPRHDICPVPLSFSAGDGETPAQAAAEHPFAGLAALRRGADSGGKAH